jgi:hypothetical protein
MTPDQAPISRLPSPVTPLIMEDWAEIETLILSRLQHTRYAFDQPSSHRQPHPELVNA